MDFRRLDIFLKVYETRSFCRAAEELVLSQPAISGHIKVLENEIGARLFDRRGRETIPTQAAVALREQEARLIMEQVREAGRALQAYLGLMAGIASGRSRHCRPFYFAPIDQPL